MQSFSACKYPLILNLGISLLCLRNLLNFLGNLSVMITGTSGFFKIFLDILQLGLRPKLCLEAASGLGVSRPLSIRITQNISGKHSFPSISCGAGALNSWGHCTDPWEIESAEGIWGVTPECPAEVPTPFLLPHHLQLQTWI